jgi:hypothetical protein
LSRFEHFIFEENIQNSVINCHFQLSIPPPLERRPL